MHLAAPAALIDCGLELREEKRACCDSALANVEKTADAAKKEGMGFYKMENKARAFRKGCARRHTTHRRGLGLGSLESGEDISGCASGR